MAVPRELYQERLRAGLCPTCGGSRDGTTKKCVACAKTYANRMAKCRVKRAKERGLCTSCPNPIQKGRYCEECKRKVTGTTKKIYADKKASGTCSWCQSPRTHGRFCYLCWFKGASIRLYGVTTYGQKLLELFNDQGGKCFYTGAVLTPGVNAGLDHQTPKSKNGPPDLENLRWVTIQINRIKNDLTHEEFLSLCRTISHRFKEEL